MKKSDLNLQNHQQNLSHNSGLEDSHLAAEILFDERLFKLKMKHVMVETLKVLRDKKCVVGFAESCTGGLLSSLMTEHAGVSELFWGSVVCYSNESKSLFLKIDESIFKQFGAVSFECAAQMSENLIQQILNSSSEQKQQHTFHNTQLDSQKNIVAVALTGVAGPTGGTQEKPVGTVFISVSGTCGATQVYKHDFCGSLQKEIELKREQIQHVAVMAALRHLGRYINNNFLK